MPPKKKSISSHTQKELVTALNELLNGESASSVSRKFGISRSTLIYKATGKTPLERRIGPAPQLGDESQARLVNWVVALAVRGFPVNKTDLLISVDHIAKDMNKQVVLPNGKSDYKGLHLFL